jgi:hypothetical protein
MKKRDYAPDSQKLAGNEQIAQEVSKNPNGAGYVGLAYTKAGGIKVVPIDGASPSRKAFWRKPILTPDLPFTTLMAIHRSGQRIHRLHHRAGRSEDSRTSRFRSHQVRKERSRG